jgi:hypothetical protein
MKLGSRIDECNGDVTTIETNSFRSNPARNGDCAKVAAYSYCSGVERAIGKPLPRVCRIHTSRLSVADDVGVNKVSE